jgi:hypothetical protein
VNELVATAKPVLSAAIVRHQLRAGEVLVDQARVRLAGIVEVRQDAERLVNVDCPRPLDEVEDRRTNVFLANRELIIYNDKTN